jgi:preprotein translocase subunit SecA
MQLVQEQERIVRNSLNEAKKLFEKGEDDPKPVACSCSAHFRGLPKYGPLIKYLK